MDIKKQELDTRLNLMRQKMFQNSLDALIIFSDEYRSGNSTYFTNYKPINVIEESPQLITLVKKEDPVVFIGRLNAYAAQDKIPIADVRSISEIESQIGSVFSSISNDKSRIGIIGDNLLPIKIFDSIKNNMPRHINGDTIKVGWAKKSLIPKYKTPMAGYGARKGAHFEGIEDSIWVSAVIFDNGIYRSAYISMDLLIIPPTLNTEKLVEGLDLESKNIYFTASHTHSSIGGYLERLAGNLFGGTFDAKILEFIRNQTRNAIIEATKNLHKARIGYASIYAADYITNRLVGDSLGTHDPYLRMIKIEKDNGENGIILS